MEVSQASVAVATEAVVVLEPVSEMKKGREAGEGGRETWWSDGKTSCSLSKSPPCSVSRVRRLLVVPPCNMTRRVMSHAKAAQAVSKILVQVQLQLVNVLVG